MLAWQPTAAALPARTATVPEKNGRPDYAHKRGATEFHPTFRGSMLAAAEAEPAVAALERRLAGDEPAACRLGNAQTLHPVGAPAVGGAAAPCRAAIRVGLTGNGGRDVH
jgi:hypothetical protein